MFTTTAIAVIAGLVGAVVGSFLNVVILRLPQEGQSIVFPGSHCPHCKTSLRWYENLPLLSYLALRGRCGHCGAVISVQYPLVEGAMALLAAGLAHKFGLSVELGGYFLFTAALLVITVIDIRHQIIPDVISLPGIGCGLIFSLVSDTLSWQSSLIGILAGGGLLYAIATIYFYLRKIDGMGGGDIKLLAMLGAWLGWPSLPFIVLASSASGTVIGLLAMIKQQKGGRTRIPFGPFLAGAGLVYTYYSEKILYFYQLYLSGQWP